MLLSVDIIQIKETKSGKFSKVTNISGSKCKISQEQNQIGSTGGNREMDQLYMMSQVSNITRRTTFSPINKKV